MIPMPYSFLFLGAFIMAPEFFWWLCVSRPRQAALVRERERTRLFWSIRDREKDIYGRWLS